MRYTRVYADSDGETHFEDLQEEFQQTQFAPGIPLLGLTKPKSASDTFFVQFPAGYSDDYHPAPKTYLFVVLTGELEVTVSDGEVRRFVPGDVVFPDDQAGRGHRSLVVSQSNCETLFVGLAE